MAGNRAPTTHGDELLQDSARQRGADSRIHHPDLFTLPVHRVNQPSVEDLDDLSQHLPGQRLCHDVPEEAQHDAGRHPIGAVKVRASDITAIGSSRTSVEESNSNNGELGAVLQSDLAT